jgi:hypothetical protein
MANDATARPILYNTARSFIIRLSCYVYNICYQVPCSTLCCCLLPSLLLCPWPAVPVQYSIIQCGVILIRSHVPCIIMLNVCIICTVLYALYPDDTARLRPVVRRAVL